MSTTFDRDTPPMFSRRWEAARDEARDLDKYEPDWDGAGADPVPLELIRVTLWHFRRLEEGAFPPPDLVYPLADGSVFVEWHYGNGFLQLINFRLGRAPVVVTIDPYGNVVPQPPETPPTGITSAADADGDPFEFALAA